MIVDAHAHIFDAIRGKIGSGPVESLVGGKVRLGNGRTIKLLSPLATEIRFTPEMLIEYMDAAGVDRAVLLQGPFYGDMNECVAEAVRRWPKRFTGAAYLDLWAEQARQSFHRVVDEMGFRVIKLELSEATGFAGLYPNLRLNDSQLQWFWKESQNRKIVVVLDLGHVGGKAYQSREVDRIVRTHPDLKIVIAHLAQPPMSQADNKILDELWEEQVLLARHPTVWLDLASLPNYAVAVGEDYPYASPRKYLRRAVTLVGAEKILWGSDIPAVLLNNTYSQLLSYLSRHCDFLSRSEMAGILGDNASTVFSLKECA